VDRLRQLDLVFGNRISTLFSTASAIEEAVLDADLVVGGVLVPGAAAPKLVPRAVARMKKGAVLVDVAIDQGGCFETSHATTHAEPDLHGGRRGALLRGQHARRGGAHLDLRAQQRHDRACAGSGGKGLGKSAPSQRRKVTDCYQKNSQALAFGIRPMR
jgi:hypothetical protein